MCYAPPIRQHGVAIMKKKHDRYPESPQDAEVTQGGKEFRDILKPAYEAPVVMPLGDLARGSGYCDTGSANREGCTNGIIAANSCTRGGNIIV